MQLLCLFLQHLHYPFCQSIILTSWPFSQPLCGGFRTVQLTHIPKRSLASNLLKTMNQTRNYCKTRKKSLRQLNHRLQPILMQPSISFKAWLALECNCSRAQFRHTMHLLFIQVQSAGTGFSVCCLYFSSSLLKSASEYIS